MPSVRAAEFQRSANGVSKTISGVAGALSQELASDQRMLGTLACGHRVDDVARQRQPDLARYLEGALVAALGAMQDEAAFDPDRSTRENRIVCDIGIRVFDRKLFEQPAKLQRRRPVDHDAEGAVIVMFTDQRHGGGEIRVRHAGHRDK